MKMTRDIARQLLNTKAVTEEGIPKLLYRGEFGMKAQSKPQLKAGVTARRKNAKHFFLKHQETAMSNGNWLNEVNDSEQFKDTRDLAEKAPELLNELYTHVCALMEDAKFVRLLKNAGYDGAITCTDTDHGGTAEYWVFDPSAVIFALTGETCLKCKKHRKEMRFAPDAHCSAVNTRRQSPCPSSRLSATYAAA